MRDEVEQESIPWLSELYENEVKLSDKVYLRQPIKRIWHELTWKETLNQARRVASFLKGQGIKRGDTVSILSKNCAHWFIADFAIMLVGAISVPLYATQKKEDIDFVLKHAEVKLIFVGKLDDWNLQEEGIPADITKVSFPYDDQMPADFTWQDIIEQQEPMQGNPLPSLDDIQTIVYTSGTTGSPKGVIYTYRTWKNIRPVAEHEFDKFGLPNHNHLISYLPLAHVAERTAIESTSLGVRDYTFDVSFVESLETFAEDLKLIQPTIFFAVPRIWTIFQMGILSKLPKEKLFRLLKLPLVSGYIKKKIKKGLGFSRAAWFLSGAAPIPKSTLEIFNQLGIEICEAYGQTENTAVATLNLPGESKFGSVGRPRYSVELKLGENDEILIKSPGNMLGYYKDEELTKKSFTEDGFLKTGDLGRIDDEGFVYIVGRVKEQFKTAKGEYITPVPIEKLFLSNNDIEQCCLVGAGLRQPVLLAVLSDAAKAKIASIVEKDIEETRNSSNQKLATHEKVSHTIIIKETWTPENGLLTPTLKLRRSKIEEHYKDIIESTQTMDMPIVWNH